jgi:hypothetical protein
MIKNGIISLVLSDLILPSSKTDEAICDNDLIVCHSNVKKLR